MNLFEVLREATSEKLVQVLSFRDNLPIRSAYKNAERELERIKAQLEALREEAENVGRGKFWPFIYSYLDENHPEGAPWKDKALRIDSEELAIYLVK